MSRENVSLKYSVDWTTIILYLILVIFGWMNIYGASYDFDESNIFDFSQRAGKQFIWILTAFGIAGAILLIDYKLYNILAYFIYGAVILLLIITIFVASDVKGSRSWLIFGPISFQPAELAKTATALALAKYMSSYNFKLKNWKDYIPLLAIIFFPAVLIVLQKETGGALVFLAFLLVLYREGMNGIILLLGSFAVFLFVIIIKFGVVPIQLTHGSLGMVLAMGFIFIASTIYAFIKSTHKNDIYKLLIGVIVIVAIFYGLSFFYQIQYNYVSIGIVIAAAIYWGIIEIIRRQKKFNWLIAIVLGAVIFSYSSDYMFNNILEPHQQIRIKVVLGMEDDHRDAGYNVNQSKIAIGSGGFLGKGYLNGTQTKLKYVPEQDTDFIFCTVGEEWGFLGSTTLIIIYFILLLRIVKMAEKQENKFSRVYGYSVASILFFHIMVNVGMVIGIMPVIGIPLPFLSYGGSSLWSFTILLFILIRLDSARLDRGIKNY